MNTEKKQTETYVVTGWDRLDAVTVYVTNYKQGQGKLVIECYGEAWAHYWSHMGENTLQQFVLGAENDYILGKLLKDTHQTDFDEINEIAQKRGFDLRIFFLRLGQKGFHTFDSTQCIDEDILLDVLILHEYH